MDTEEGNEGHIKTQSSDKPVPSSVSSQTLFPNALEGAPPPPYSGQSPPPPYSGQPASATVDAEQGSTTPRVPPPTRPTSTSMLSADPSIGNKVRINGAEKAISQHKKGTKKKVSVASWVIAQLRKRK